MRTAFTAQINGSAAKRGYSRNLTLLRQRTCTSSSGVISLIETFNNQEKVYNPYYTFVGQQLCRTSHSHKITLQFCLWDFLRDLGETSVGGAEVLKNLNDDSNPSFDVGKISSTRIRNVARAYAWWITKDSCTLAILKVSKIDRTQSVQPDNVHTPPAR